ncbi:hypothetical protein JCM6882_002528 [Rhodosporidiobolus microsporus]
MSGYVDEYGAPVAAGGYHPHQHVQQQQAGSAPVSITQRLRNHGLSINVGDANRGRVSPGEQQQQHQQQQTHQDEYGYDGRYGYAEQEAHDILEGEDSPHGSDEEVAEQLQMRGGGQQHYAYEDDLHGEQGLEHAEGEEEDLEDDAGSFSDSLSSSPSIPDEDIDFNLVYALHTFLATVDGQASVVKGDKLLLLDDSNSYWWLVRVLKTQAIGYIPAENIETPWERLARLNKHRNVDLTSVTQQDVITGPTSTTAQTRFIGRIPPSQQPHPHESRHPYSKGIPASPSHKDHPHNISPQPEPRPGSSKAKVVLFTAPTYYAHSATGMTTDDEEGYEGEEGEYDEEGMEVDEHEHERGGGFEDDEEEEEIDEGHQAGGEESEFSDEEGDHLEQHRVAAGSRTPEAQRAHGSNLHEELAGEVGSTAAAEDEETAKREHWERETAAAMQAQQQAAEAEAQWAREREQQRELEVQQQRSLSPHGQGQAPRRALSPQNVNAQQQQLHPSDPSPKSSLSPRVALEGDGVSAGYSPTQRSPRSPGRSPTAPSNAASFDENDFASGPTKKLTATPPIARDDDDVFDPLADADMEAAPYELRYQSPTAAQRAQLQPLSPSGSEPLSPSSQQAPQKVRGVDLVDPKDPRYHRMLQPTKQAGEDVLYERMVQQQQQAQQQQQQQQQQMLQGKRSLDGLGHGHDGDTSMGSVDTTGASSVLSEGSTTSVSNKRASSSQSASGKDGSTEKKRKSGGGILGLFRKKDKKKNRTSTSGADAQREEEPRSSEDSARASPTIGGPRRRSGSASPASPRASAERASSSTPTAATTAAAAPAASKRDSANTAESMFSTDAALRQQELEAKQALYQQYGVQRAPGDVTNTMTPRNGGIVGVGIGGVNGLGVEPQPRSSTGSNRNSLQLLTHPASVVGANGVLGSPSAGGALAPPQRIRPGSLMGSPSIPGLEVPLLSVMRVFAGSHIDSEATFKTVLLNQSTTSADLVKQAMQRFRLVGADLTRDDFFLTVKEIDGEERPLEDDEKPLVVFEDLSERAGEDATLPPSVKRSSIGSITSISSNLSLNPAITRLGMNDWSDDSAVKFYLNRRGGPSPLPLHNGPASPLEDNAPTPTIPQFGGNDSGSDHTSTPTLGSSPHFAGATASPPSASSTPPTASSTTPNYRFAVRLVIHPADLPDTVVFDPQSNAIIPKAVLLERQQRAGGFADPNGSGSVSPNAREKIIFFPRNANVSEVVEAALDRFGISDGVVDGGDEVEDRVSRRRSVTRVKYSLAAEHEGKEILLNASSKLLEAYVAPPLFKAYDRSSKEFRRRSVDATLVLGTSGDVQPSDPVFILRRSAARATAAVGARGPHPLRIDELEEKQQREEEQEVLAGDSPPVGSGGAPSQRDLIAAQRAAQRANQRAILSAQKNSDQGVDINIPEHGTIRSARDADNDEVRYSFINQDGTEVDISEIVENEWSTRTSEPPSSASSDVQQLDERAETVTPTGLRPTSQLSRATSAAPSTADSFQTAREAPSGTDDDDDDQHAIDALRSSSVAVDRSGSSASRRAQSPAASSTSLTPQQPAPAIVGGEDVLRDALGPRPVTSPVFNESLQERLDRVLARVKEEKARRAASPAGSRPRSYISAASGSATPSGRLSPAGGPLSGRISPSSRSPSSLSNGRRSPFGDRGRDSPSIDQILQQSPRSAASPPRSSSAAAVAASSRHGKQPSIASLSSMSGGSSSVATDQPSTPVTANSNSSATAAAFTPATSANSNHPPLQPPILYRVDDFGYERLEAIVQHAAMSVPSAAGARARSRVQERDEALEGLFGRELDAEGELHPQVREGYEAPRKAFADLDARLDALLLELVAV